MTLQTPEWVIGKVSLQRTGIRIVRWELFLCTSSSESGAKT
jgi:hypothetical protein